MPKLSKADSAAKVSATEARRRKEVALARLREMEVAQKAGLLLPASDVRATWAEQLGALKDRVLILPDRLAARLANRPETEVRTILRDELEQALRAIHANATSAL